MTFANIVAVSVADAIVADAIGADAIVFFATIILNDWEEKEEQETGLEKPVVIMTDRVTTLCLSTNSKDEMQESWLR